MTEQAQTDFSKHMEAVAGRLLGEPNRALSKPGQWRFGTHGSLAVDLKKGTFYDHEADAGGGVLDLIARETGLANGAAVKWLQEELGVEIEEDAPVRSRIVQTYDYTDAEGRLLYQAVRFEPKTFRQRRPNGAGGWDWNVKGIEAVPYRLPELVAGGTKAVLIPGGEKDVDNLRALGFTATCNHGGEGKWWPGLTRWFRGRPVFILCDNDAQGEKHQAVVGAALQGIAAEVRVVRFPHLPEKGDVSDWIAKHRAAGLDGSAIADALKDLCRTAPLWEPTPGASETEATTATADWPNPDLTLLSDHRLPPPELPLEIFGNYWSGWIRDQAEAKSCSPDYVAAGLLAAAGVLIGNARWGSPWAGWAEPPVLWFAAVGNPSSGKSPGLDATREIATGIEIDANEGHKEDIRDWDTAKRAAKLKLELWEGETKKAIKIGTPPPDRPHDADEPERPTRRRIVTSDATVERLARLVLENPKGMLLFRDELAGWIGSLDRYGGAGGDRAFYLESYGGRPYAVDRQKDPEPIVVPSLTLGIVGGIQPDRLQRMILSGDDDGLAARFIFAWPERVPPRRPSRIPPTGAKTKLAMLYELQEPHTESGDRAVLPFVPAAADLLQSFREHVAEAEAGASGLFLSWQGKLPGMAVRLACIIEHLLWCGDREHGLPPTEISELAAASAICFLSDYAAPMAKRCFGEAALPQEERDAVGLARWIMQQDPLPEMINAREARLSSAPIGREAGRYEDAFAELEEAGWVRLLQARPGRGRKAKTYEVNPALWRRAS